MILRRASIETYLLRQIIRADVEGSFAGFLLDTEPLAGGGFGDAEGLPLLLPLTAASVCWLFFLRAMSSRQEASRNSNGRFVDGGVDGWDNKIRGSSLAPPRSWCFCMRPPACSDLPAALQRIILSAGTSTCPSSRLKHNNRATIEH